MENVEKFKNLVLSSTVQEKDGVVYLKIGPTKEIEEDENKSWILVDVIKDFDNDEDEDYDDEDDEDYDDDDIEEGDYE